MQGMCAVGGGGGGGGEGCGGAVERFPLPSPDNLTMILDLVSWKGHIVQLGSGI